jgi:hypothetical protein
MPGPVRVLLLFALVASALAGCGGGGGVKEANTYVDEVNRAQNRFASTIDTLSTRITSTSTPADDRATLGRFEAAVGRVVTDLRAVHPPDQVRGQHAQLIAALEGYGTEVKQVSEDISSGSASRLLGAQEELAKATADVSQKINATIAAINHKLSK